MPLKFTSLSPGSVVLLSPECPVNSISSLNFSIISHILSKAKNDISLFKRRSAGEKERKEKIGKNCSDLRVGIIVFAIGIKDGLDYLFLSLLIQKIVPHNRCFCSPVSV